MTKNRPKILAYAALFLGSFLSGWGYFTRNNCLNPERIDAPGGFVAVSPADWICSLGDISFYIGILFLFFSPIMFHYSRDKRFLYLEDMLLRPKKFYSTRVNNKANTWLVLGVINAIIYSILWTLNLDSFRLINAEFLVFKGFFAELLQSSFTMILLATVLASITHLVVFISGKRGFSKTFSAFFHSLIITPFIGLLFHIPETSLLEDPTLISIPLILYYFYTALIGVYLNHFEVS